MQNARILPQVSKLAKRGKISNTSPIVGTTNVAQLRETLGTVGLRLSEEEIKTLDEMSQQEE
jgi:aryl-alcohol dehydrogenase-like predicted oxidoreductase